MREWWTTEKRQAGELVAWYVSRQTPTTVTYVRAPPAHCTRCHRHSPSAPTPTSIMPPLPSAIDEETSNIISSLERRQKDLVDFQIPRLRTCTGPLALQQQYTAEIRDDLDVFARQLEVRLPCGPYSYEHANTHASRPLTSRSKTSGLSVLGGS